MVVKYQPALDSFLLVRGNTKLGETVFSFSIPARSSCPGRTRVCEEHCYALSGHYHMPSVKASLRRNRTATLRRSFVPRMRLEILARRARVVRVHVAGDFYSARYAEKWLAIALALPGVRFYLYTRSWRVAAIRPVIVRLAALTNVMVWLSADAQTGRPPRIAGARVAYMQAVEGEVPPANTAVHFRVKRLRATPQKRIGLALVCPVENGVTGHRTDCGACALCFDRAKADRIGLPPA